MNQNRPDTYKIITNRIIDQLEQGFVPWHKTWAGSPETAKNLISGQPYRGLNSLLLNCLSFTSPYFLTFKQAKGLGGNVKKGEKGIPVIFWKFIEKENDGGRKKSIPICRYYTVFNITQCENIEIPQQEELNQIEFNPIEKADQIVKSYKGKPEIKHESQRAFYSPSNDVINMPAKNSFESSENYYSVLFHEMAHSTGHEKRLNREEVSEPHFFGDEVYSREELTAEITSLFLSCDAGISCEKIFKNSTAYIQNWIDKLRNDKRLIISASGKAQKAVDYILGKKEYTDE